MVERVYKHETDTDIINKLTPIQPATKAAPQVAAQTAAPAVQAEQPAPTQQARTKIEATKNIGGI